MNSLTENTVEKGTWTKDRKHSCSLQHHFHVSRDTRGGEKDYKRERLNKRSRLQYTPHVMGIVVINNLKSLIFFFFKEEKSLFHKSKILQCLFQRNFTLQLKVKVPECFIQVKSGKFYIKNRKPNGLYKVKTHNARFVLG